MSHDLEAKKREISAIVDDIVATRAALGIPGIDDEDRMEAMDIINRIERRILSKMKETAA